jgi:integrase
MGKGDRLGDKAMSRFDVLHMIKRRAQAAGLPYSTCCHTFRATGITTYLENGGTLEHAQTIANHESPRTTKLTIALARSFRSTKWKGSESKVTLPGC